MNWLRKNQDRLALLLFAFAYVGLLFPIPISNITIITLVLFCLVNTKPKEILRLVLSNRGVQFILLFYTMHIVGVAYSSDVDNAFFNLEKKSSLVLIPLFTVSFLSQRKERLISQSTLIYGLVCMGSSIFFLLIATYKKFVQLDPLAFYFENFATIHYVFYSLHFSVGSLFLIDHLLSQNRSRYYNIVYPGLVTIYSILILFIVSSKSGIICFSIGLLFILYRYLKSKTALYVCIAIFICCLITLFTFNDTTRNRFLDLGKNLEILSRESFEETNPFSGFTLRVLFWKFSVHEMIERKQYLMGTGTGDAQHFLDKIYEAHKLTNYGFTGYDSHNQWVFTFIQLGCFGLLGLGLLYVKLFDSIRDRPISLYFLLGTGLFSLTESILESNKGIVFFALIVSLILPSLNKAITQTPNDSKEF
jgi:O-antigen ligase